MPSPQKPEDKKVPLPSVDMGDPDERYSYVFEFGGDDLKRAALPIDYYPSSLISLEGGIQGSAEGGSANNQKSPATLRRVTDESVVIDYHLAPEPDQDRARYQAAAVQAAVDPAVIKAAKDAVQGAPTMGDAIVDVSNIVYNIVYEQAVKNVLTGVMSEKPIISQTMTENVNRNNTGIRVVTDQTRENDPVFNIYSPDLWNNGYRPVMLLNATSDWHMERQYDDQGNLASLNQSVSVYTGTGQPNISTIISSSNGNWDFHAEWQGMRNIYDEDGSLEDAKGHMDENRQTDNDGLKSSKREWEASSSHADPITGKSIDTTISGTRELNRNIDGTYTEYETVRKSVDYQTVSTTEKTRLMKDLSDPDGQSVISGSGTRTGADGISIPIHFQKYEWVDDEQPGASLNDAAPSTPSDANNPPPDASPDNPKPDTSSDDAKPETVRQTTAAINGYQARNEPYARIRIPAAGLPAASQHVIAASAIREPSFTPEAIEKKIPVSAKAAAASRFSPSATV